MTRGRAIQAPAIVELRRVGEDGLLIEVDTIEMVHRVSAWLNRHPLRSSLTEVVPAARTVFVVGDLPALARVTREIRGAELPDPLQPSTRVHVLAVRYDGVDLPRVAERTGLGVAQIVRLHTEAEYTVDFFGFAPGHAYLSGVPEPLRIPRRPSPRTAVPAGAVAIANEYSVIYPAVSPGGWNLIGTSLTGTLWDSAAQPPNRVAVGDRIVFRAAG